MLAYVLALAVGLGSAGLYAIAFALPEIHRKNDIIWSGVGLFYALVLWVCANRISGGVLLGQIASVALLGWFAWQTLMLRREALPVDQQTPLPTQAEIKQKIQEQIDRFTKGQNSGGAPGGGTIAQLQQGLVSLIDRVTATIEGVVAKFKKTQTPTVKVPQVGVKPPANKTTTSAGVTAPPVVETPPTPVVETPPVVEAPPAPVVETPPVVETSPVVEAPAVVEANTTPSVETPVVVEVTVKTVEITATPVDLVSPVEIETPSVADTLPSQETQFQSPTDEQIEAAIRDAEADSK